MFLLQKKPPPMSDFLWHGRGLDKDTLYLIRN